MPDMDDSRMKHAGDNQILSEAKPNVKKKKKNRKSVPLVHCKTCRTIHATTDLFFGLLCCIATRCTCTSVERAEGMVGRSAYC